MKKNLDNPFALHEGLKASGDKFYFRLEVNNKETRLFSNIFFEYQSDENVSSSRKFQSNYTECLYK